MKTTTINLKLRLRERYLIHERTIANCGWASIFVVFLVLISRLLQPIDQPTREALTVKQPVIMFMTTTPQPPLPTYTPMPVPTAVVIIQQAPAPPPEIIEVPVEVQVPVYIEVAAPAQAVPTPAPVVEQPACDERCQNIRGHYVEPRP